MRPHARFSAEERKERVLARQVAVLLVIEHRENFGSLEVAESTLVIGKSKWSLPSEDVPEDGCVYG